MHSCAVNSGAQEVVLHHARRGAACCAPSPLASPVPSKGSYIARPAVSNERLSVNDHGQVVHRLKRPFGDGTTHVVLDPIEFMRHIRVPHPFGAASGCANRQSCRFGIARLAAPECRSHSELALFHAPVPISPDTTACSPTTSSTAAGSSLTRPPNRPRAPCGRGGAFSEQPWRGSEANGGIEPRRDFWGPILLGHLAVAGEIRVRTIVSARATPGHADMRGKVHIVVM